ncbi:sulfatase-like hydrolase/transferase [Roseicyclus sp. F158]|uniref:Sulfatase-like hydrolase/transferase n=1 Tax=Tropicimonas omnivorans TaxID=3075590 RepID=A0ABU3DJ17_9RHOB|nr:sulfatase-like hydrolase/transferase [Roseicyclus sp. F158]MDT0683563.1 sulfatase-like hydrolase/transferase [Roseicyclus sp. F158]
MKKPNVLLIMADEMQAAALSCAGHPLVRTPNLDRLAERGCRFTNAYTPSPICVPARAAFATGRYVHQTGYWDNATAYDGRVPGWTHALQEAGVEPISIGKLHYRSETDPTGFSQQVLPLHIAEGIGQVWGSVRDPLPETPHPARMIGAVGAGCSKYNRYDISVADETAREVRERSGTAPWILFSSFVAPHFPLVVPKEYLDLYPAEEMPLPDLRPVAGHARHPWLDRMDAFQNNDSEFETDDERRLGISAYFGLCTFVDAQIGRILDALEDSGQSDDTLVLFCSDHGEMLGRRGRWGKSLLYGESTRIPLIAAGPGISHGTLCETPVSLLDIAPTVTQALGAPTPDDWVGRSLLEILTEPADRTRVVFSEYHAVASPSGAFRVATADWAYHEYVGYPPELFDLRADPGETRNLADDPAHGATRAAMRRELLAICDPEEVDREAKTDQNALVARFGGPEAASKVGPMGASPVPI